MIKWQSDKITFLHVFLQTLNYCNSFLAFILTSTLKYVSVWVCFCVYFSICSSSSLSLSVPYPFFKTFSLFLAKASYPEHINTFLFLFFKSEMHIAENTHTHTRQRSLPRQPVCTVAHLALACGVSVCVCVCFVLCAFHFWRIKIKLC